jgi:hypothetical protein
MEWKNGKTTEQVAREVLRNYLIRCHRTISTDYPEVANMEPADAADYLLHLQDTGRIAIQLYAKSSAKMACRITDLQPNQRECSDGDES